MLPLIWKMAGCRKGLPRIERELRIVAGTNPAAYFLKIGHDKVITKSPHFNNKGAYYSMNWVYFAKLFRTRFQAGCLAKRLEQDGWIYGYHDPRFVEIYRSRKGKYGVRFLP